MSRKDYRQHEEEYQKWQDIFYNDTDNIEAWQKMFHFINLAVYNNINQKVQKASAGKGKDILDKEKREARAIDITLNIMESIQRKIRDGREWRIDKLSSFVYLPCLYIYNEKYKREDGEITFTDYYKDEYDDEYQ